MVVSVNETRTNPYYNCYEEDGDGFLKRTIDNFHLTRRQDAPKTYEYNGAIYVMDANQLKRMSFGEFKRRVKYVMDDIHSVDLDNVLDWKYAEFIIKEGLV